MAITGKTGFLRKVGTGKYSGLLCLAAAVPWFFMICGCSSEKSSPVIGKAAPDFTYQRLGGSLQELSRFRGRVVLVRFWADWCRVCIREMPAIEKYYKDAKEKGLVVLAINVRQSRTEVEAFARNFGLSFPIGLDEDGKITKSYGVKGIPSSFLIDRGGILRKVYYGPIDDESMLNRFIEPYL